MEQRNSSLLYRRKSLIKELNKVYFCATVLFLLQFLVTMWLLNRTYFLIHPAAVFISLFIYVHWSRQVSFVDPQSNLQVTAISLWMCCICPQCKILETAPSIAQYNCITDHCLQNHHKVESITKIEHYNLHEGRIYCRTVLFDWIDVG